MQVTIVVILLSFCASLALPVPLDKTDQEREEREISVEELESELEDIQNRISSVRTKVKEESKENKETLEPTKGTPPTFTTKTSVERKTTAANVKTSEGVHIIVEKITSSTLTPEPTEPTLTQKKQPATKVSTTPSTEKKPFVIKVEVEQEQKAGDAEEKLQEDDKEKSEGVFVVQKVTEEEEENKQTAEEPETFKVSKVTNDETDWNEEADLESGKTGGNERPKETVGNAAVTTPVKTAEIGITVEKITPSPKSPTKSTQSEVVKVERVPSKQNVETKRSSVERIEEDEDLKVGGAAQSPDGEGKVEVTVEKESTETSSAKESSPAKAGQKDIIVEVKKVSPSTDEEVKEVEVIAKPTVKPTATKEVSTSQGKVEEVSISVEKITVPPSHVQRPTSGKSQTSMVSKVVKLTSEDEDLETSLDAVNYKRSDDASEKTSNSEEEALELELEGDKDNIDEQKLAQEFDKALEAERNGKENLKTDQPVQPAEGPKTTRPPQVTTGKAKPTTEAKGDGADNQLEHLNVEAVVEKMKVRKIMSDEEMELAELAQESMNDEDKEQVKPTKKPTTATSQEVVIKVEKVPKVTVQVTKERNENLLSEEETAKEEKKLKVELVNELEQEKEGPVPVIVKVKKLADSPDPKPTTAEKATEASDKQKAETNTDSEEEEQEAELESDADAKSKRSASITRNDPEAQLENLLAM